FDNSCPEDQGFEGAAARELVVEGSSAGPDGPWVELGHGVLEKAKNDQIVELAPNEGRWLRVALLSNHGHPVLMQLVRGRAFAAEIVTETPGPAVTTDEGPFRLERLRLSLENRGAEVEKPVFDPGQSFWIYFKPRALQLSSRGEYSLEVDLRFEDA